VPLTGFKVRRLCQVENRNRKAMNVNVMKVEGEWENLTNVCPCVERRTP
jgi:hypothetical protein